MLRDRWEFKYTARQLRDAAAERSKWHRDRLEHWKTTKDKVMNEIRESGVEVLVSGAGQEYYSNKGVRPQLTVDSSLQIRLDEAHNKVLEHSNKIREYEGWVAVFDGNPDGQHTLHADDYLYFFGKN